MKNVVPGKILSKNTVIYPHNKFHLQIMIQFQKNKSYHIVITFIFREEIYQNLLTSNTAVKIFFTLGICVVSNDSNIFISSSLHL